ncbi:HD domain-containing phosphohydrolase, partial [Aldersonia kunmingensis]|uniref:HD domain-containing phosphohydrolase n=1 Tax=Aldersonia kunmingensis TaxID=408066 RepID=UPI00082E8BA3
VATEFSRRLGLPPDDHTVVFQAALLRSIGCTAYSTESAAYFDDDVAFQAVLKELDPGDPEVFGKQIGAFGNWAGPERQPELAQRFLDVAPTQGPVATRAACEVGHGLADRLQLAPRTADALDFVYERWDGRGFPGTTAGEALPLPARVVHVSEQAVLTHGREGTAAACAEVRRRAGGHLDPALVDEFVPIGNELLGVLDAEDAFSAVVAAEPGTAMLVGTDGIRTLAEALAMIVDLKGRYLLGHSQHVARIARAAARELRWPDEDVMSLEIAALLHDLGRVGVPASVWDRPGPLPASDEERARLHPYWTARILQRCPTLCRYAEVAANHHERLDGSGFPRGAHAGELDRASRLLAAADAFAELTECRPNRAAFTLDDAARAVSAEARAGRLDAESVAAVIAGAGAKQTAAPYPGGLTRREVEVARLAAQGLSNKDIAGVLTMSPRTVGNHLARIYDKIDRRSRAGTALFLMENGLLPQEMAFAD